MTNEIMTDQRPGQYRSHLFTLRIWSESLGQGQAEWRGQVRHVTSGQTRYFREWPKLLAFLQETLPILEGEDEATEGVA